MIPDPNDEILEIKRKLSAEFGNDIHRIAAETRRRQNLSGRKILSLPPRRIPAQIPTNNPLQRSGEASVLEVENLSSPPAER
jgi:hypothetical protein